MATLILDVDAKRTSLPSGLMGIVSYRFVERDRCWFLRYLCGRQANLGIGHFPDRTEFECFVNIC
jgi:hypothetical protein